MKIQYQIGLISEKSVRQSHHSTGQVARVNTAAGDESYLSGRQLHAVTDLGWCGYAGVAA